VVRELEKIANEKRDKMLTLIKRYGITVLGLDQEAEQLADTYVEQGIIPVKYRTDSIHIAIGAVNDVEMIIKHELSAYCKEKNKFGTANSNTLNGYRAIEICSPMEVHDEKT